MPIKLPLILGAIMLCSIAYSQGLTFNADSTFLAFPNGVHVSLTRPEQNSFCIEQEQLQVLIAQVNYLLVMDRLRSNSSQMYSSELLIADSFRSVIEEQLQAARAQTENYRSGYVEMKAISESYYKQLDDLISQVTKQKQNERKLKRKSFLRGLSVGICSALTVAALSIIKND